MICITCSLPIESERLEVLPETRVCSCCARKGIHQKPKVKGVVVFAHKTGGYIQVIDEEAHKDWKKYNPYGKYTGRGSGVHRMTKSTAQY